MAVARLLEHQQSCLSPSTKRPLYLDEILLLKVTLSIFCGPEKMCIFYTSFAWLVFWQNISLVRIVEKTEAYLTHSCCFSRKLLPNIPLQNDAVTTSTNCQT